MKPVLKIFVTNHCPGCSEARTTATRIKQDYPHLAVELIDLDDPQANIPEAVFATPTYMLNNRIVSLGNPDPVEVARWASEAMVNPIPSRQVEPWTPVKK